MLFSGYLIPFSQIPSYFLWAYYYASFFQWGIGLLQVNQWWGVTFPDTGPLDPPFSTGEEYLASINYGPEQLINKEWQFFSILGGYVGFMIFLAFSILCCTAARTKT